MDRFRQSVTKDPFLSNRFSRFEWSRARVVRLDAPRLVYVSYRKGERVAWTRRKLLLARGETLITDGSTTVRSYCCNEITDAPAAPTLEDEPAEAELQPPLHELASPHRLGGSDPFQEVVDAPPGPPGGEEARSGKKAVDESKRPRNAEIPEPGSLALLATGVIALAAKLRAKSSQGA